MKKEFSFSILLFICFWIISCDKNPVANAEESQIFVCFHFQPEAEITPFHSTKAIPPIDVPEPIPVPPDKIPDEEPVFSKIDYVVYDKNTNELIKHMRFEEEDKELEDFGTYLYDVFNPGEYIVAFCTHSISNSLLENNILTFDSIGDLFYGKDTLHIQPNSTDITTEITLKRLVSKVEFVAKDNVPQTVNSFRIEISGIYKKINILTGETIKDKVPETINDFFNQENKMQGTTNIHEFYTLVPSQSDISIEKVTLTALTESEDTIRQREIRQIPIVRNKIIRYRGILYSPIDMDGQFEIILDNDGKWEDILEKDLDN